MPAPDPQSGSGSARPESRLGFCQECGREVTATNVRREGQAMFCEPCFTARGTARAAAGGWQSVPPPNVPPNVPPHAGVPPPSGMPYGYRAVGGPNPLVAAILGFIPGVGAMYNGQFAKGFAHLLMFAVVESVDKTFHGIFDLLCVGFVFYQVFDAYATAKARRYGMPLPDPFGLNNIGERMGFTPSGGGTAPPTGQPFGGGTQFGSWFGGGFGSGSGAGSGTASSPGSTPPSSPFSSAAGAAYGFTGGPQAPGGPSSSSPPPVQPPFAGYASDPASHGANFTAPPFATAAPAGSGSGWTHSSVPYQETFGGAATAGSAMPLRPGSSFPVGAVWLIGLGCLFLVGNLMPSWHVTAHWMGPAALLGLAGWLFFRRWSSLQGLTGPDLIHGPSIRQRALWTLRAPILLATLAILLGLQSAGWVGMSHTWPVMLLVFGCLMLADRVLASPPMP